MRVNVFVDDVPVGSRVGCDALVGDTSCAKTAVGAPFFHEGLPRDICEGCMALLVPGKSFPSFRSSHYDTLTETHSTAPAKGPQAVTSEAATSTPGPPPPAFPSCPKCGGRSFAVTQTISELKAYEWDSSAFVFRPTGEPQAEHVTRYGCSKCGETVSAELLAGWIS